MKKYLIAVALGLLVVAAFAVTARADNGPHGNFAPSTDACAGCHRAHSAQGTDFLLTQADVYVLCTGCHNGAGAYTNVVDGVYQNASLPLAAPLGTQGDKGVGLFGGGFERAAMNTTRLTTNSYNTASTNPAPVAVTSHHDVDTGTAGTVWGSGPITAGASNPNDTLALECTSCHDPHGKAGRAGGVHTGNPVPSYRLLRFSPTGSNGYASTFLPTSGTPPVVTAGIVEQGPLGGVFVDEARNGAGAAVYWYTINADATIDSTVQAFRSRGVAVSATNPVAYNTPWWAYVNGRGDYAGRSYIYERPAMQISTATTFAVGTSYVSCSPVTHGAGNTIAFDANCALPGNPAAGSAWNNTVPMGRLGFWCSTCHDRYLADSAARSTDSGDTTYRFRHATTSVACVNCHTAHGTTAQMTTALAQNATLNSAPGLTGNTNMLKLDNRGLCADCHGYEVGFSTDTLVTP
jgi:predicted CXXCH cytochrome family protein